MSNHLGATIRAWRDRLSPKTAGLPVDRKRRSPGLRREELAELAGISVDYVVRLEQGRASTPSGQVLNALARALRLAPDERDHLYRLAGLRPPADGFLTDRMTPAIQRLLSRLAGTPAAVFAADWSLVWWNDHWAALFGDPSAIRPEERNLVRLRFPVAGDDERRTPWPAVPADADAADRALVTDLCRASARYPDDPRLEALVSRTLAGNSRFARLWSDGEFGRHDQDRQTIRHPVAGDITLDCDVFTDADTDLKIVAYTAVPGSEDETSLKLAGSVRLPL